MIHRRSDYDEDEPEDDNWELCMGCYDIYPYLVYYCEKCMLKWYHTTRRLGMIPTLCSDIYFRWLQFERRREKEVERLIGLRFYKDVGTIISDMMFK